MHNLEVCFRTKKGNKRELNEDSLLAITVGEIDILAIADGVGGHAAGEVASKLAITEIEQYLKSNLAGDNISEALRSSMAQANAAILKMSKENETYLGMASTLVAAAISPELAVIANIGDSRAYMVGKRITRVTRDHSLVQQLVDNSMISEEESFTHHQKNIITMSLGRRDQIKPNFYHIDISDFSGKTLLLCSDGLNDSVKDKVIGDVIYRSKSLEEACDNLLKIAEAEGGFDDITVILGRTINRPATTSTLKAQD
jgi:PPM family protein phosphatase